MTVEIGLGGREAQLSNLARDRFDVVVVGGGIAGAGIALDLAARDLRVALVEQNDFAAGTSSRSSKLIHGGLRYLAQYQFDVTREALLERRRLLRLAPALVDSLPFVIPVFDGTIEAARIAVGLALYDLLAGRESAGHFAHVRRADLRRLVPGLSLDGLTAAYTYHDCRTDDARLVLSVLRAARQRGAVLANHAEATALLYEGGAAAGVRVRDRLTGDEHEVRGRAVVLATGPWGDRQLATGAGAAAAKIRPSKGVHLFLPRRGLHPRLALYLPTGIDERLVFKVPWQGGVLVGTTDSEYSGPIAAPQVDQADVDYLLAVLRRHFPDANYDESGVKGAQAGIRPLVLTEGPTTRASREDQIWRREDGAFVIAGGKLTTYRRMAERVAAALRAALPIPPGEPTTSIPVAPLEDMPSVRETLGRQGLPADAAERIVRLYGVDSQHIATLVASDPSLGAPLSVEHPALRAEIVFFARHEQARRIGDVLARRIRLLLLDYHAACAASTEVANLMGRELGWDADAQAQALRDFDEERKQYRIPAWS